MEIVPNFCFDWLKISVLKTERNWSNINSNWNIIILPLNLHFPHISLDLLMTLNWLCAYQLEKTAARVETLKRDGKSAFDTRNDSQIFHATTLSMIYGERTIFMTFYNNIKGMEDQPEEQKVLFRLLSFYGLNLMVKYSSLLYEGGFAEGELASRLYKEAVLHLLPVIKMEAISLIDAIAPSSDFILNSPLGMSDGEMYKHMETRIFSSPEALTRPSWWDQIVHWKKPKL